MPISRHYNQFGMQLGQFANELGIPGPLGLEHTSFPGTNPDLRGPHVAAYVVWNDGSLREVTVGTSDQGFPRPLRTMAMPSGAQQAETAVPVEAGKSTVVVTVSGSVQLK